MTKPKRVTSAEMKAAILAWRKLDILCDEYAARRNTWRSRIEKLEQCERRLRRIAGRLAKEKRK